MIKIENENGSIFISQQVFANLVGYAATSCYGVAGMSSKSPVDGIVSLLYKDNYEKGVKVTAQNNELNIEFHIVVIYGVNIPAITRSITKEVRYAIEDTTGLKVGDVTVYVDSMKR